MVHKPLNHLFAIVYPANLAYVLGQAGAIVPGQLRESEMADILISNHGSVVILQGVTDAGKKWLQDNIINANDDVQTWGQNGVVCEPRYVDHVVDGMINDGLEVV